MNRFRLSAAACAGWLCLAALPASAGPAIGTIHCAGEYPEHPQGVATDGTNVYWSYTSVIAKTDLSGKLLAAFTNDQTWCGHAGDLCCRGGHVFAGVNRRFAGDGSRKGDEVWEFDSSLVPLRRYPTPEMVWCNNGLEWFGGSFWIVCSAPNHCAYNFVYEYTPEFRFKRCLPIASGWTMLGVQTICLHRDKLLFGCYGNSNAGEHSHPCTVLSVDTKRLSPYDATDHPEMLPCETRLKLDASCGMLSLKGRFLRLRGICLSDGKSGEPERWTAELVPHDIDAFIR